MPDSVDSGYNPDYVGMQMFQSSPYIIADKRYQQRLIELRDRVNGYASAIPANTAVDPEHLKQTILKIAALNDDLRYRIPQNPEHTIVADGLYTLWYAAQKLARTVATTSSFSAAAAVEPLQHDTNTFSKAAGEALGVLSAVAQHRLGTTLASIAQGNLFKIQRRAISNTLQGGPDPERSKAADAPRHTYSEWDVACASLFGSRPLV